MNNAYTKMKEALLRIAKDSPDEFARNLASQALPVAKQERSLRKCLVCGGDVLPRFGRASSGNNKYCSIECEGVGRRRHPSVIAVRQRKIDRGRQVMRMKDQEGKTFKEIGAILSVSRGRARDIYEHARRYASFE